MDKVMIDQLPLEKQRFIAVSHLIRAKEERPEGTEKLFGKLSTLENAAAQTSNAINATEQTLGELNQKFMQTIGSLQTITELIAEMLPEDKIQEWCEKYTPPNKMPQMPGSMSMPGKSKIIKPSPTDMAGITAKQNQQD